MESIMQVSWYRYAPGLAQWLSLVCAGNVFLVERAAEPISVSPSQSWYVYLAIIRWLLLSSCFSDKTDLGMALTAPGHLLRFPLVRRRKMSVSSSQPPAKRPLLFFPLVALQVIRTALCCVVEYSIPTALRLGTNPATSNFRLRKICTLL